MNFFFPASTSTILLASHTYHSVEKRSSWFLHRPKYALAEADNRFGIAESWLKASLTLESFESFRAWDIKRSPRSEIWILSLCRSNFGPWCQLQLKWIDCHPFLKLLSGYGRLGVNHVLGDNVWMACTAPHVLQHVDPVFKEVSTTPLLPVQNLTD
jgi:hypothetical protein